MAKCCGQEETGKRNGQGRTLEEEAELPWREAMQRGTGQREGQVKVWGAGVGEKVLGELLGEGREKAGGLKWI